MGDLCVAVNLGNVGQEVEDTAGVTPLVVVFEEIVSKKYLNIEGRKMDLHQETSLTKLSLSEIPALASKMEDSLAPHMSEETISSSV